MVLESHMKVCMTEPNFLAQKLGKWFQNGPKTGLFQFIEKIWLLVFTEFNL